MFYTFDHFRLQQAFTDQFPPFSIYYSSTCTTTAAPTLWFNTLFYALIYYK